MEIMTICWTFINKTFTPTDMYMDFVKEMASENLIDKKWNSLESNTCKEGKTTLKFVDVGNEWFGNGKNVFCPMRFTYIF